jgi:hypothetical protein
MRSLFIEEERIPLYERRHTANNEKKRRETRYQITLCLERQKGKEI